MRSDTRTDILHVVPTVHYSKSRASICTCWCSKWSSLWTWRRRAVYKRSNLTNRQGAGECSGSVKASFLLFFIIRGVEDIFIAIAHPVNFSVLPLKRYRRTKWWSYGNYGRGHVNPGGNSPLTRCLESDFDDATRDTSFTFVCFSLFFFFFWCQLIQRDAGWDACYCSAARTQQGKYKIDSTIGWVP